MILARAVRRGGIALGTCVVYAAVFSSAAGAAVITDLGTLPGGTESYATAINASGDVTGESGVGPPTVSHAFYWTRIGGMVDLGTLGGESSYGDALNNSGQVVGYAQVPGEGFTLHAFSWTPTGGMVDLGTFGGRRSVATAVNDAGEVVGYAELPEKGFERTSHAFVWTAHRGLVDLGTLGGADSVAYAVNATGEVVGSSQTSTGEIHAFAWTPKGGMYDLGVFSGRHYSKATLVNDVGDVAGQAGAGGYEHGFFWTPEFSSILDIGTLDETAFSEALGMSNIGQVVGVSWVQEVTTYRRAFSWTHAGGIVDLGTLGGAESEARAVNAAGEVVGEAGTGVCHVTFCDSHAFAWRPQSGMVDLDTLGGNFSDAAAINESGAVAGSAQEVEQHSHAVVWNLEQRPTVTGVAPSVGPAGGGTEVKITGERLANATAVAFGNTQATSFAIISETEIQAISPLGSGIVDVTVTSPEGRSAASPADRFGYLPPPRVSSVTPPGGPTTGGTTVTITGVHLAGVTSVTFGATTVTSFREISETEIEAVSPPGTGTIDVTVVTPGGESEANQSDRFSYLPRPAVKRLSRRSGPVSGGTVVKVIGTGFLGAVHVDFGSMPATSVTVNSSTSITAISPASTARRVDVTVTTRGGESPLTPHDRFRFRPAHRHVGQPRE